MWNENEHPRDKEGKFTKKDFADMSAAELKEYILESQENISGAVSGAIDPDSERGIQHAERFYEEMRHRKDDVPTIAKNTGIPEKEIEKIKKYIFFDEHDLLDGYMRFYPNADMADSWQRLVDNRFRDVDITMIRHEMLEMQYVESGFTQAAAHDKANEIYNYGTEIEMIKRSNRINGLYKKHKQKR